MDNAQTQAQAAKPNGRTARAATTRHTQWLEGISGSARFLVGHDPYITLSIHHGDVDVVPNDIPVDVTFICKNKEDVQGLLRGELNPVVASLQGRLGFEGDFGLAVKVLYGFHGGGYPFVTPPEV
jgi:hypothetical protein